MAKSYLFECEKCGYRAVVVGGTAEGHDLKVQTMTCKDCRSLYDGILMLRVETTEEDESQSDPLPKPIAPDLASVLAHLPLSPTKARRWREFVPACPHDATHRVEPWNSPGRCPRCQSYMERAALPYRIWD